MTTLNLIGPRLQKTRQVFHDLGPGSIKCSSYLLQAFLWARGLGSSLSPFQLYLRWKKVWEEKKEDVDGSDERRGILFHVLFFRIRTKEKVSSLYFISSSYVSKKKLIRSWNRRLESSSHLHFVVQSSFFNHLLMGELLRPFFTYQVF